MISARAPDIIGSVLSAAAAIVATQADDLTFAASLMDAIGIGHLSGPQAVAGMCFAVLAGFIMMLNSPPEGGTGRATVAVTAAFMGLIGAGVQQWVGDAIFAPMADMPPQAFMGLCGLSSRYLVDLFKLTDMVQSLIKTLVTSIFSLLRGAK